MYASATNIVSLVDIVMVFGAFYNETFLGQTEIAIVVTGLV